MSSILMKPIESPKAWRGETLAGDPSWVMTLDSAEIAELDRALGVARATGRSLSEIEREHFPLSTLPGRLARVFDEIHDGRGFVVLRGLPVARRPPEGAALFFRAGAPRRGAPLYQTPQGDPPGQGHDHARPSGNIAVRG